MNVFNEHGLAFTYYLNACEIKLLVKEEISEKVNVFLESKNVSFNSDVRNVLDSSVNLL